MDISQQLWEPLASEMDMDWSQVSISRIQSMISLLEQIIQEQVLSIHYLTISESAMFSDLFMHPMENQWMSIGDLIWLLFCRSRKISTPLILWISMIKSSLTRPISQLSLIEKQEDFPMPSLFSTVL